MTMIDDDEELECLDGHDGKCEGPVGWHSVGASLKACPRCDFHAEQRWERYENSIEKYADSDVEPDWFDATIAGERWSDDY